MATRLIRVKECMAKTGLCKSAVFALSKEGKFPPSIKLGGTEATAWVESQVDEWIAAQIEAAKATGWQSGPDALKTIQAIAVGSGVAK